MAFQKIITEAVAVAGVRTLTVSDLTGLMVGYEIHVDGVGAHFDGNRTITELETVDNLDGTFTYLVSFTDGHVDVSAFDVLGLLNVTISWITAGDVTDALGQAPAEAGDLAYLDACVASAQEWCFEERRKSRYHDLPHLCPSASVKAGTVQKAVVEYRERGALDGVLQFDGLGTAASVGSPGAIYDILRKLGCRRPAVY